MRRLIAVATLVALSALPLWAQGRRIGSVIMPRSPAFVHRSPGFIPRAPIIRHGSFGTSFNGFAGFRHHPRIFVRFGGPVCNPFFFDCRFSFHRHFFAQPAFFPIPIDSGYPYQPVYAQPETQIRDDARERELETQIANLSYAIDNLRAEEQSRLAASYRPEQSPPPKIEEPKPTVLVFRDKHILEIANYAIMGQTLWVLSEHRARKIPLNDLDLGATTRLNRERGVEFHPDQQF